MIVNEMSTISQEFIAILEENHENGVTQSILQQHFTTRYAQLTPIINELLASNRLQLYHQGDMLVFKILREETAAKFDGLGPEQMLVYQVIERAANKGIWTRDIKMETNIQEQVLKKSLKILEQRNLIKIVRSVVSKTKKLYMLYNLEPAKEVSGGPWYTDQEFDYEFLELLAKEIVSFVSVQGNADAACIAERIRSSGIANVELSTEDLDSVIQTLVYDGQLEESHGYGALSTTRHRGAIKYRISKANPIPTHLTDIPCGVCPVMDRCKEGGIISPSTCEYMKKWLNSNDEAMITGSW